MRSPQLVVEIKRCRSLLVNNGDQMDGLLFTQFPPLFDGFVAAIIMSWWLVAVGYGDSCYHHACHLLYMVEEITCFSPSTRESEDKRLSGS
jgi:hypothetical protein|uniref:Uncharacterized protein n=1 Tax=Populus trichocarpa TaxID=3694 RepID=A0A2K2A2C6_POPTR